MPTELRKVTQLAWRKHLLSEAGIEGMLILRERTPVVGRGESHNIIFDAGVVEGYRRALDSIEAVIAAEQPKPEQLENP